MKQTELLKKYKGNKTKQYYMDIHAMIKNYLKDFESAFPNLSSTDHRDARTLSWWRGGRKRDCKYLIREVVAELLEERERERLPSPSLSRKDIEELIAIFQKLLNSMQDGQDLSADKAINHIEVARNRAITTKATDKRGAPNHYKEVFAGYAAQAKLALEERPNEELKSRLHQLQEEYEKVKAGGDSKSEPFDHMPISGAELDAAGGGAGGGAAAASAAADAAAAAAAASAQSFEDFMDSMLDEDDKYPFAPFVDDY